MLRPVLFKVDIFAAIFIKNSIAMNEKMFCFQCQETAGGTGCKISGVCGKSPEVAHAQDLLIYVLKGLGVIANHHQHGCGHDYCDFRKSIHAFVNDALFSTITNANFDVESIYNRIDEGLKLRDTFKDRVLSETPKFVQKGSCPLLKKKKAEKRLKCLLSEMN